MPARYPDSPMRPRDGRDFYPTPMGCAQSVIWREELSPFLSGTSHRIKILDAGSGMGIWGKVLNNHPNWSYFDIYGIDPYIQTKEDSYIQIFTGNFLKHKTPSPYDVILGNPPYGVAEEFIHKGLELVHTRGIVAFLLRNDFLGGQRRFKSLFDKGYLWKHRTLCRRPSFSGDGKTDAYVYSMFYFRPFKSDYFEGGWINWDYTAEDMWGKTLEGRLEYLVKMLKCSETPVVINSLVHTDKLSDFVRLCEEDARIKITEDEIDGVYSYLSELT